MRDFVCQVATVRDRITVRLRELRIRVPDPGGALVLAVTLVEADTTDEGMVNDAVGARWDQPGPRTDDYDPIRNPPATYARWKTIPKDPDLIAELSNRLSTAWAGRPEPAALTPTEEDLVELQGRLFAIEDEPHRHPDFQAAWNRYVKRRPWTVHERALDGCGLSVNGAPVEPALHAPKPGAAHLDRGVLQRLDRPLRQPGDLDEVFARISVVTLVVDEIDRSVRPLGLRDEQALAALTLGLAAAGLVGFTDPRNLPRSTEHAPVRVQPFLRVEKLARRYHGRHTSDHSADSLQVIVEHLREDDEVAQARIPTLLRAADRYRDAMDDPTRSIGPRLHPRLHRVDIALAHGESQLKADAWWERLDAALNSWIKDIYGGIDMVLTADPVPARRRPATVPGPAHLQHRDPAEILELVQTLLDGGDPQTADPLAILDVTATHYLELVGGSLQSAFGITRQQAQAMLPPWREVAAAVPLDWGPELSPAEMYTRSRALCRSLGIEDELLRVSPHDAADLYAKSVAAHVARAQSAGALVTARHYSAAAAFVTRLRNDHRAGTGQVADIEKVEES